MAKEVRPATPISTSSSRNVALLLLKPLLKAYLFGHLSSTAPRVLGTILKLQSKSLTIQDFLHKIRRIVSISTSLDKFPSFCALLTGCYTLLQSLLLPIIEHVKIRLVSKGFSLGHQAPLRVSRFIAAFISAFAILPLLNGSSKLPQSAVDGGLESPSTAPSSATPKYTSHTSNPLSNNGSNTTNVKLGQRQSMAIHSRQPPSEQAEEVTSLSDPLKSSTDSSLSAYPANENQTLNLAGKTLDLTVLACVRAIETLVYRTWAYYRQTGSTGFTSSVDALISTSADPLLFSASTATIMWAWIYAPERLPYSYNKWITAAAQVDQRLVLALRHCRYGDWVYGQPGEYNHLLADMAVDYGIPRQLGDPEKTAPVACSIVHMGAGDNCHWHAAVRFARAFRFSIAMYLPLQLAVKLATRRKNMSVQVLRSTIREAMRSSAFLGAFISLFYYSVCAGRSWLGPKLFDQKTVSPRAWDGGYAVGLGCGVCGWSVLLERESRRQELACFVAPRAAATVLPRRYEQKYFWRERLAFSVSLAYLFTLAQEHPRNIRGFIGTLLHGVLQT